jgi:hypothetical protein
MKITTRIFGTLAIAVLPLAANGGGIHRMEFLSDEWHLAGFENSLDLSGIAAANPQQCLVGSDESFYIQPGVIDYAKKRIESKRPIALSIQNTGKGGMEVDIEGVAFSPEDQAYFVVGSHGLGKKKGDFQPDRHAVYQVPVDKDGKVLKDKIRRTSLLPWLEKTPVLEAHVKQPLQQNGLNIEGLTYAKGKLFFGLRAPNKNGRGFVIELSPKELFSNKPAKLEVHDISIPKGRGIREIAAVKDGFILLSGNASAEASKKIPVTMAPGPDDRFDVYFWDGSDSSDCVKLGSLPQNGGKAEALLVLEDAKDHVDMLIVFDGLQGGEPMTVRFHR